MRAGGRPWLEATRDASRPAGWRRPGSDLVLLEPVTRSPRTAPLLRSPVIGAGSLPLPPGPASPTPAGIALIVPAGSCAPIAPRLPHPAPGQPGNRRVRDLPPGG